MFLFCILGYVHKGTVCTRFDFDLYFVTGHIQRKIVIHLKWYDFPNEAEFLGVIETKVLKVFLLSIHSKLSQQILLSPSTKLQRFLNLRYWSLGGDT